MEVMSQHPGDSSSSTWRMAQGHTLTGPMLLEGTPATMWGLREQRKGLHMMRGQGSLSSMAGHTAPTGSRTLPMIQALPQHEGVGPCDTASQRVRSAGHWHIEGSGGALVDRLSGVVGNKQPAVILILCSLADAKELGQSQGYGPIL